MGRVSGVRSSYISGRFEKQKTYRFLGAGVVARTGSPTLWPSIKSYSIGMSTHVFLSKLYSEIG